MQMRTAHFLMGLSFGVLFLTGIGSVKVSYHDENILLRSTLVPLDPLWGPPAGGAHECGFDLIVPLPEHGAGKGAIALFLTNGSAPGSLIIGNITGASIAGAVFAPSDLDGDGSEDLLVSDTNGSLYLFTDVHGFGAQRTVDENERFASGLNGTLALADVGGDGYPDLLHIPKEGTMLEMYDGPLPPKAGKAVLTLPLEAAGMTSSLDLTGDGVSETAVWGWSMGPKMVLYNGITLSPLGSLDLPANISSSSHGDLNGDGLCDLAVVFDDAPPFGRISVLFGGQLYGSPPFSNISWSVIGAPGDQIHGTETLVLSDMDGDGCDDMLIGAPESDPSRGRLSIIYGSRDRDYGKDLVYSYPDADLSGDSPGDAIGTGLYSSYDLDGDMLPDIWTTSGEELRRLELPMNSPPSAVVSIRFERPGTTEELGSAQVGDLVGISCTGVGSDNATTDVMMIDISSGSDAGRSSFVLLRETDAGTGVFRGQFKVDDGTVPGRSLMARNGDTVTAEALGAIATIRIKGRAGQDDPPYLIDLPANVTVLEDQEMEVVFQVLDPDGDPVSVDLIDAPVWTSMETTTLHERIFGTPDNTDVGIFNITVKAGSTGYNVTSILSVHVVNTDPSIMPVSAAPMAWEEELYSSTFVFMEEGAELDVDLSLEGPVPGDWLQAFVNGSVMGRPGNRHVGNWSIDLTLNDGNGGKAHFGWNITVVNEPPVITGPSIDIWPERERVELDFNCTGEGDGLTTYTLLSEHEGAVIDPITGVVAFNATEPSSEVLVRVRADDGNGASSEHTHSLRIVDVPPWLSNRPPVTIMAGEQYFCDLASDEEGSVPNHFSLEDAPYFFHPLDFNATGRFVLCPWSSDVGVHRSDLYLNDAERWRSHYEWTIEVLRNSSFVDPSITINITGYHDGKMDLRIVSDQGSLIAKSMLIEVSMEGNGSLLATTELTGEADGKYTLFIGERKGALVVSATMRFESHPFPERELTVRRGYLITSTPEGSADASVLWMLLTVPLILIVLLIVAMLTVIERTSYSIQSAFFKGGRARMEEVLTLVQDRPGIRFREIIGSISLGRRDLMATLRSLQDRGHIRAVRDGLYVRFLPTVGSFVNGPLVLSKHQSRIIDVLKGGKERTLSELQDITGLSSSRLQRELSLLLLKGALSRRKMGQETFYFLTAKQRARVDRWVKGGR